MEAATAGSSLLTGGLPEGVPPPAVDGTPAQPVDGATQALQQAQDAPPEWAPAKYWDPKTRSVKTEDLGKAYINLEKLLGREKVPVPTSDDDEEGWHRWYAASGRPEAPDKYEFQRPEKLPDGLDYDEDLEKEYREWAHKNGLNKRQAKNFYDGWVKRQIDRHAAWDTQQKQTRAQAEAALRREHGAGYEAMIMQAKTAVMTYTDPDYREWLDKTGLANDPRMVRVFARIGKEMNGDTRIQGKPMAENPADIDRAMSTFRDQHKEALFDKSHPDHDARVKELSKLYEKRYPEMAR